MRKRKAPRPAVWVATFKGVWFVHPVTGDIASRSARNKVTAFTVAVDKEEAVLRMVNGLNWFDDIENVGKLANIKRLKLEFGDIPPEIARLTEAGARFIVPYERLGTSLVALMAVSLIGVG